MKILITSNFKKYFNTHIDFLDYYWIQYFDRYNISFQVISNSISNLKKVLNKTENIDLVILPGGNDINGLDKLSKTRLKVENEIIKFSIKKNITILGICRGMQVINCFFEGNIKKTKGHMNTKHQIFFKKNFFKKEIMKVNSFHNFCITEKIISKKLEIFATDSKKNVEMFKHKKLSIYGVMWHPEREKSYKNLNYLIKKIYSK